MLALAALMAASVFFVARAAAREVRVAELKSDFVSSVSHELRTPLTQIRMLAELLSDEKLRSAGERTRAVHIIRREAQRLTQLVENILQFARIRAAGVREELREVDLDAAVREVVSSFQPLAESAGATIGLSALLS